MTTGLVVVGGSVATSAFLERLRDVGVGDAVTVVDPDPDAPYDRPPLSKRYLLDGEEADITVDWSGLGATFVRAAATGIDVSGHRLRIRRPSGEEGDLDFARLVIASGALPVRLPVAPGA